MRLPIRLVLFGLAAVLISAVGAKPTFAAVNPFFTPSTLPFGAPPFDRISDADYQPAIEAGMADQLREIDAIANNPVPPTFQNTLVALERSGRLLDRALSAFYAVTGANTDPTLQRVEEIEAPKLAAHNDAIYLNPKLFARVQAIYSRRAMSHLDSESQQLLKVDDERFVRSGAQLAPENQAKLRDLNKQLAMLQAAFQRKLLAGTAAGALVVSDSAELVGMSDDSIDAAAQAAESRQMSGKWLIPLQNTTQQPALQMLDNRSTREHLFEASWTRTENNGANDTRDTVATIAQLRAQKAQLLGYSDYAAYALTTQMAKDPATVEKFLSGLIAPTKAKASEERSEIQAAIDKSGTPFQLQPWDWNHYADRVRKAKYDFDESAVRPYFELNNVLHNGLFYAANQLYGITFKERHDIPVYQPDVRVFEVFDKDGSPLALMYFDFFKRDNKLGGAWMSTFVNQSKLLHTKPVVYNVENFTKPAAGQPALLTAENVTGMFHEFGHALNGFFADQEYESLSGAATARDFVEYPSQFNEHWAFYPKVLAHYAVNYKTGEPMPAELLQKMAASSKFNEGYDVGEVLAADEVDMAWHTLPASAPKQDPDAFEKGALEKSGTDFEDVPPRYRSTYFSHIWSGGYAAGYYAYMWSEMLDDDTFQWFVQHGGLTRSNGQRFRDMILSRGHSEDYGPMFRAFYGSDPKVGPLLDYRGLAPQ
ncbi:MAG: M3 family metallopeptidase [Candidatus Eremiobacteraeota bacterium]|nr:M3 family metallopeptidase [Candidatus Eremiobacteraeota bacterium]